MTLYLLFFLLLMSSAFFSGSETALFSIGKVARLRLIQGDPSERRIAQLLERPRDLLITVLFGNELTNIALSIVAASITHGFLKDRDLHMLQKALLSGAFVLPLLILLGEVTPKTLAAQRSEGFARLVVWPLGWFNSAVSPARRLLRALTDTLLRNRAESREQVNEGEFRSMVDAGAREGVVEDQERVLIHKVLDFGDQTVAGVMRPFSECFTLALETPVEEAIEAARRRPHSRIPVWQGELHRVVGILHTKDLLAIRWGARPPVPLRNLLRPPIYVPSQKGAADLLELFRQKRTHIAIVITENREAIGLCTMEDLLEELFGPITDDPEALAQGLELA